MKILLLGSTGFIGKRIFDLLKLNNFEIIAPNSRQLNFLNPNSDTFNDLLKNFDVVINTVGIMSRDKQAMESVHHHTPLLFANLAKTYANQCKKQMLWINLSALGADENSDISFVGSKGRGDKAIVALKDEFFRVKIIRPSLIYGHNGTSTKLFLNLAKLPLLFLPSGGKFLIQPVHADDVALGIMNLINNHHCDDIIHFTGNQILTLADYLTILRKNHFYKDKILIIPIPFFIAKLFAFLLQHFTNLISVDSLTLLKNGNLAENKAFKKLLNKPLISVENFY